MHVLWYFQLVVWTDDRERGCLVPMARGVRTFVFIPILMGPLVSGLLAHYLLDLSDPALQRLNQLVTGLGIPAVLFSLLPLSRIHDALGGVERRGRIALRLSYTLLATILVSATLRPLLDDPLRLMPFALSLPIGWYLAKLMLRRDGLGVFSLPLAIVGSFVLVVTYPDVWKSDLAVSLLLVTYLGFLMMPFSKVSSMTL